MKQQKQHTRCLLLRYCLALSSVYCHTLANNAATCIHRALQREQTLPGYSFWYGIEEHAMMVAYDLAAGLHKAYTGNTRQDYIVLPPEPIRLLPSLQAFSAATLQPDKTIRLGVFLQAILKPYVPTVQQRIFLTHLGELLAHGEQSWHGIVPNDTILLQFCVPLAATDDFANHIHQGTLHGLASCLHEENSGIKIFWYGQPMSTTKECIYHRVLAGIVHTCSNMASKSLI